ncbi:SH3 domain-binding protein 2 isoform 2-T2 [Anomaloglossus baeobatrachus]|uniref:SH3 domain-binding protein 2 isoform X2 n=1 Tax=Anomaloglossus baeobatrachus TaxID=238106 RepID=UPI003F508903
MATSIKRSKSRAASVDRRNMCRGDTIRNMASGENSWPIPMRAIGAQNLLTMPGGVTVSGYLHKRGGKQLQLFKWPLRYVIIHKGCVYYFKTSTSATSQGAFSLNGYNRVMRAAEETTSNNVFPFKMVHISKKHRTWYFSAASEEERKKWMMSLRKEIDRYHEKKETITDLSDSGSETDSFYGSIERPVDIKYTHNPAEDSYQDEDDDEEDYEQPDVMNVSAPSYPPPPVPVAQKPEVFPNWPSTTRASGIAKPPSPPSRSYPRKSIDGCNGQELGVKPPVPTFPPVYRATDLLNRSTDNAEKEDTPPFPCPVSRKPPVLPPQPPVNRVEPLSQSINDYKTCQPNVTAFGTKPSYMAGKDFKFKDELSSRLNIAPPMPKPTNKSNFPTTSPVVPTKPTILATKPTPMNSNGPPIPVKPRALSDSLKSPEEPSPIVPKPIPCKPPLVKPPTLPRLQLKKPEYEGSGYSPKLSPPDGQSFRDITMELPVRPAKPKLKFKDDRSDSDDDYEKVPLPATVFVDTFDSFEVERMFKATDARGSPLNGLFCIRNSAKAGKVLVVWDKLEFKLRNYRIFEKDCNVYLEAEMLFPDLATMVEHYYANPLPSHDTLVLKYAYGCSNNPR